MSTALRANRLEFVVLAVSYLNEDLGDFSVRGPRRDLVAGQDVLEEKACNVDRGEDGLSVRVEAQGMLDEVKAFLGL